MNQLQIPLTTQLGVSCSKFIKPPSPNSNYTSLLKQTQQHFQFELLLFSKSGIEMLLLFFYFVAHQVGLEELVEICCKTGSAIFYVQSVRIQFREFDESFIIAILLFSVLYYFSYNNYQTFTIIIIYRSLASNL